jgi:hypothetical protein
MISACLTLRRATASLTLATLLVSCQSGPSSLISSSAHYSDAVRVAQSEQFLANLVRLRYGDLPVFLGVSSISTQFEFGGNASLSGEASEDLTGPFGLGLGVSYSERPTITFDINGGGSYQRRMLLPISVESLTLLTSSGWRPEWLFRVAVEQLNGLENAPTASGPTPTRAPEYRPFLDAVSLLQRLIDEGLLDLDIEIREELVSDTIASSQLSGEDLLIAADRGIEFRKRDDAADRVGIVAEERRLVLRFLRGSESSPEVTRLRELLNLDPGARRVEVVAVEDSDIDILEAPRPRSILAIKTRSLEGMLHFLSHAVEVPVTQLESGVVARTIAGEQGDFDWRQVFVDLFHIRSSDSRPSDAAVAVQHRGRWFSIDDRDRHSKAVFMLMRGLFTLQARGAESVKPVLTLPIGG